MGEFAVGTTVFMRTDRLRQLLASVDGSVVSTVYVSDVGDTGQRRDLYARSFPFDLEVLDLPYDAGVARGRERVVDALDADEEYVLIVDCDNEIPDAAPVLAEQLDALPDVGGIAGSLIEPERGRIYQAAADLAERGDTLVKSSRLAQKRVEYVAGQPFVPFRFVPNVTMFRRACLEDYCWDPEYVNHKEHIDFFVGHWKETDWRFGVNPVVFFPHYPGGSEEYQARRFDADRSARLTRYFYDKWGYETFAAPHGHWFDTHKVPVDPTKGPRDLVEELPKTPAELLSHPPSRARRSLPRRALGVYREDGLVTLARKSLAYLAGR